MGNIPFKHHLTCQSLGMTIEVFLQSNGVSDVSTKVPLTVLCQVTTVSGVCESNHELGFTVEGE